MESKHTKGTAELKQFWQGGVHPVWEIKYSSIVATIVDHDLESKSFEKRQEIAEDIVNRINRHDDLVQTLKDVLSCAENKYIQFFTFGETGKKIIRILNEVETHSPIKQY